MAAYYGPVGGLGSFARGLIGNGHDPDDDDDQRLRNGAHSTLARTRYRP